MIARTSHIFLSVTLICFAFGCTDQVKNERDDDDEELVTTTPVPITGINLTFEVPEDIDEESVDAYIVGYPEALSAQKISDRKYLIANVPDGLMDVIITGKKIGSNSELKFDHGLRMTEKFELGSNKNLGIISIPKSGSISGRLEMDGISSFKDVNLSFEGTKLPILKPNEDGSYVIPNLPVGNHPLSISYIENPIPVVGVTSVESNTELKQKRFLAISQPNIPANFLAQPGNGTISLSWDSGGGDIQGYVVLRSLGSLDGISLKNGSQYQAGDFDGYSIIYAGTQNRIVDRNLINGLNYKYSVFAYNKNFIYSDASNAAQSPAMPPYEFEYYRLNILSAASSCDDFGNVQITRLHLHFDNAWQKNYFSTPTNDGKIGNRFVQLSSNTILNSSYDAYLAFRDNNSSWSSKDGEFDLSGNFDFANGEAPYIQLRFIEEPVQITGLDIYGGEPPFFTNCSPDSYTLTGSTDGVNFVSIAGSDRNINTEVPYKYYFETPNQPLAPHDFRLIGTEGLVNMNWESAQGNETGFVLVRSTSPVPFQFQDGQNLELGDLENGYSLVYKGTALSYNDTDVQADGVVYYYSLASYDSDRTYSSVIVGRAVPEKRQAYRYYRFVVKSIIGGPVESGAWLASLAIQIDGNWASQYTFTAPEGTIDGVPVTVNGSSEFSPDTRGYHAFVSGKNWRTMKGFSNYADQNAIKPEGEYILLDFGDNPTAITGFEAFGNTTLDAEGNYSQVMFEEIPDCSYMEYSDDGITWTKFGGSESKDSLAEAIIREW